MAVRPFDCLSAVRPWDLALERGMLRAGSADIGSVSGCQGSFLNAARLAWSQGSAGTLFVRRPRVNRQEDEVSLGAVGSVRGRHPRRLPLSGSIRIPARRHGGRRVHELSATQGDQVGGALNTH